MKIAVLLKIVPDTETRFQIGDSDEIIMDGSTEWILGPYDEYAIEEAIRIKEKLGGEVISVTIGSGNEEKAIRKAMAMGVDRGILVENEELANSDSLTIAKAYAELVKPLNADIVLTGKLATDTNDAFVGPAVAQLLGIPVITEISDLDVTEGGIIASRSASGRTERFESSLPVLLTADKALNDPRYPKLPDIMKAKRKPLDKNPDLSVSASGSVEVVKAEFPPVKSGGKKIEGSPEEVVSALMDGLTKEEKLF